MATKIKNLAATQLTLASHVQFHTEALALIGELKAETLHLATLYPVYQAAVGAEADVVNRPTAYAETQQMTAADHNRDLAVSLIFNLVSAYSASPLATHTDAAATLAAAISPYRGIQSHEMNRQTTEVDGLTAALAQSEAAAALETLGIEVTAELLAAANTGFRSATAARDTEALRRQPVKEADTRALRTAADQQYHAMADTVNAYTLVNPTTELTTFVSRMNVLIDKYRTVIANQGKTPKKPTATDTPSAAE